jgi:hypothetical protein
MTATTGTPAITDARPFLPADINSPWTAALNRRDVLAEAIEAALAAQNIRALILKSQPGVYPVSLSVTAWTPQRDRRETIELHRESVTIAIEVNPYLTQPLVYGIEVRTIQRAYHANVTQLGTDDAVDLVRFALGKGPQPGILPSPLQHAWDEFVERLPFGPKRNPLIKEAEPNRFTTPALLSYGAAALAVLSPPVFGGLKPLILVIIGGLLTAAWVIASQRSVVYNIVKRPEIAPRSLALVDSWHTSIPDVGVHFDELVDRIERAVSSLDPLIRLGWENHQYRTPYGFEERRRLTLTKEQAVVHIHLYPFAADAFVGWDGFLNLACWAETVPVSVSVRGDRRIEYRSLTVSSYQPTEVDLVELNALSELVHRRMTIELRAFMKEREIEADIDFSIIRGSRDGRIGKEDDGDQARPAKRGGWRALRAKN